MKKIEPFMWVIFDEDGDYETNSVNEFSCGRSGGRPLYTREALEAAVEAVKKECMEIAAEWQDKYVVEDNAYLRVGQEIDESVDTAAIINQLTGE